MGLFLLCCEFGLWFQVFDADVGYFRGDWMAQFLSDYLIEAGAGCELVLGGIDVLFDHRLARIVMSVFICAVFLARVLKGRAF